MLQKIIYLSKKVNRLTGASLIGSRASFRAVRGYTGDL
jgi:hypothetical protein